MQVVDVGLDKSAIWWDSVWKWGILPPSYGNLIGKMMIDHCIRDESHNFQTNWYKSLQTSRVASIRDIVIDCLLKNTKDRLDSKIGHCKSNLMVRRAIKIQNSGTLSSQHLQDRLNFLWDPLGFAKALYSSRSRLAIMNSSTALVAKFTMTSMKCWFNTLEGEKQHETIWNKWSPLVSKNWKKKLQPITWMPWCLPVERWQIALNRICRLICQGQWIKGRRR